MGCILHTSKTQAHIHNLLSFSKPKVLTSIKLSFSKLEALFYTCHPLFSIKHLVQIQHTFHVDQRWLPPIPWRIQNRIHHLQTKNNIRKLKTHSKKIEVPSNPHDDQLLIVLAPSISPNPRRLHPLGHCII
jgi:hypothetical protein